MVTTEKITADQMSYLLNMVHLATRRKFSNDEGSMWLHLLSDHSYDECHEAITHILKHARNEFLSPALVIEVIQEKRLARWKKDGDSVEAPNGLNGKEYLDWLEKRKAIVMAPPKAPRPPSGHHQLAGGGSTALELER